MKLPRFRRPKSAPEPVLQEKALACADCTAFIYEYKNHVIRIPETVINQGLRWLTIFTISFTICFWCITVALTVLFHDPAARAWVLNWLNGAETPLSCDAPG